MTGTAERRKQIAEAFEARHGAAPTVVWCRAPGCIDLMGSHADHTGGLALTLPINLDTWIAARPRPDRTVSIYSLDQGEHCAFNPDAISFNREPSWSNHVRRVTAVLRDEGFARPGFNAVIHSTLPLDALLGSTAVVEATPGAGVIDGAERSASGNTRRR